MNPARHRRRRVVAFDLGGVVVDVDKSVLAQLGPPDLVERAFFVGDRHDRLTTGDLSADEFVAAAAAVLGRDVDVVRSAWAQMVAFSAGGLELVNDVAAVADIAVWSNTDPVHWHVLAGPLSAVAVDVATSFCIGAMKPQPTYFARALQRLTAHGHDVADGENVVFVDDRADNVAAARLAGIDAHCVQGVAMTRALLTSLGVLATR